MSKKKLNKEISISEFKAKALSLLQLVHDSGQSLIITKHNAPLVQVLPIKTSSKQNLNQLAHTVLEMGDIVSPSLEASEWDMLK